MGRGPRPDLAARNRSKANPNSPSANWPIEYRAWQQINYRCHNPRSKDFARYGARGISVCPEWRTDVQAFIRDMGPRPPRHSIERLDNEGPYSPENCIWATTTVQSRNRRSNHRLEFRGETLTITEWALRTGISKALIRHRVAAGWPVEEALTSPPSKSLNSRHRRSVTHGQSSSTS